jgi:hypothetical protein
MASPPAATFTANVPHGIGSMAYSIVLDSSSKDSSDVLYRSTSPRSIESTEVAYPPIVSPSRRASSMAQATSNITTWSFSTDREQASTMSTAEDYPGQQPVLGC